LVKKIYVLDTNVLLDDLKVFDKFGVNEIVLPFIVLEELDKHKTAKGELGANARNIIRQLDTLSKKGDLLKGVLTDRKVKVSVSSWDDKCKATLLEKSLDDKPDNKILVTALCLGGGKKGTVLVTNDVALRIKAKSLGVESQEHFAAKRIDDVDSIFNGLVDHVVQGTIIDQLYSVGEINLPKGLKLFPNEYVHLIDEINEKHTAIGCYDGKIIQRVITPKSVGGIKPRSIRQSVALDALMNPEIELVTLLGRAGTGKTLCALAAAVELIFNKNEYEKMFLIKPVSYVGESLGFLPGTQMEKMLPHMSSFIDNLLQLFPSYKDKDPLMLVDYLISSGKLQMDVPVYLRGRSISNALIIVDEVQNLTNHEIKTICTRLGEGSKLILLGDLNQIDNAKLDPFNNGLIHVIEAFKDEACASHLTFVKGERSGFADIASIKL